LRKKALTCLWSDISIKLRNLIAHAAKKLSEAIAADNSDMI